VKPGDLALTALARGTLAGLGAMPWAGARAVGERLGDAARVLGVRRRVAEANLALAFPAWGEAERRRVLREHYRELGRVTAEYAHVGRLARAPAGEVVADAGGLDALRDLRGRGVIIMSGHFSNFELLGALVGRMNPVDFLVRPLSNPGVEALISGIRARAGVGCISTTQGTRGIYAALAAGRWVAILGDQDARRRGCFVPFLGRPASTAAGPARVSLKTGAPIVMGFLERREDGRFDLVVRGPLAVAAPDAPDAVERLTALHTAVLEERVRARPELWFWLHRRWKTKPPDPPAAAAPGGPDGGRGR
jgi:Kdo2-lipid IVA lauroyltransferase/acyltransferase